MDDEAPKWVIVEEDGGGRAASVVKTGAANATDATWECPSHFLPLPLSLPLCPEPLELCCLCCCQFEVVMTVLRKISDFVDALPFLFSLYYDPDHSRTFHDDLLTSSMTHTLDHSSMA